MIIIQITSDWKLDKALALLGGNVVSIKEIAVESGLETAREDLREAVLGINLVSVDPIQNVEESVHSQGSHVV